MRLELQVSRAASTAVLGHGSIVTGVQVITGESNGLRSVPPWPGGARRGSSLLHPGLAGPGAR